MSDLKTADVFYLAALYDWPEQRIVQQPPGPMNPKESIYFRRAGSGALSVNKLSFRRLIKGGWLRPAGTYGDQVEWTVSDKAREQFQSDHTWQQILFYLKSELNRPKAA